MCISIPALIQRFVAPGIAEVVVNGQKRKVTLVTPAGVGQWVLLHGALAIKTLDDEAAAEILELLRIGLSEESTDHQS